MIKVSFEAEDLEMVTSTYTIKRVNLDPQFDDDTEDAASTSNGLKLLLVRFNKVTFAVNQRRGHNLVYTHTVLG